MLWDISESVFGVGVSRLTISYIAGIYSEVCDQYIAAHNGQPPRLTKVYVPAVRQIEHQAVVCGGILVDEFRDKWT